MVIIHLWTSVVCLHDSYASVILVTHMGPKFNNVVQAGGRDLVKPE